MPSIIRKSSVRSASGRGVSAQKRAAAKAEEAAKILHTFATTLNSLNEVKRASHTPTVTSRNWWKIQGGRFREDPTFNEFVAQVQAARKREG
jgi:hypothetical protein